MPLSPQQASGKEGEICKSERPINYLFWKSGAVIDITKYSLINSVEIKALAVMLYAGPV